MSQLIIAVSASGRCRRDVHRVPWSSALREHEQGQPEQQHDEEADRVDAPEDRRVELGIEVDLDVGVRDPVEVRVATDRVRDHPRHAHPHAGQHRVLDRELVLLGGRVRLRARRHVVGRRVGEDALGESAGQVEVLDVGVAHVRERLGLGDVAEVGHHAGRLLHDPQAEADRGHQQRDPQCGPPSGTGPVVPPDGTTDPDRAGARERIRERRRDDVVAGPGRLGYGTQAMVPHGSRSHRAGHQRQPAVR